MINSNLVVVVVVVIVVVMLKFKEALSIKCFARLITIGDHFHMNTKMSVFLVKKIGINSEECIEYGK